MVPIVFTEDDDGEYRMKMPADDVIAKDNSISIIMDDENDDIRRENDEVVQPKPEHFQNHHNHSFYDEWTTMTPQQISIWIDK